MAHTEQLKQHVSNWRQKCVVYRDKYKAMKVRAKCGEEETRKLKSLLHKVCKNMWKVARVPLAVT